MASDLKERLTGLLEPQAVSRGFDLVLLEIAGTRRTPVVQVYLDHEGGITIDQIAEANKWIDELLDPLPEMANGYTLEVSSPGIERPLVKLADFARFAGSEAKISVSPEVDGHKRFTGVLQGVEGDEVLLDVEGETVRIPHESIRRAHLRVTIDFSERKDDDDGL
jgi:ribosome maturation factor RimP